MISRVWTALTTEEDQHKYYENFRTHVLPALRRLAGYQGATLNSRRDAEGIEILVITKWRSVEAVRAFAGPDVEQAVVADEAALVLTQWDRHARHYDVILDDAAG
jgi:heme-degrading monooxygenase HmoA